MAKEEIRVAGNIHYLTFENLRGNGVLHGFTLRHGGVSAVPYDTLNLGTQVGDEPAAVRKNRDMLAKALGYQAHQLVSGQQVHGIKIQQVTSKNGSCGSAEDGLPATDGLLCTEPDVVLLAYAADCTILFFFDPHQRCIGLAHAGLRGAVAGMAPTMVEAMVQLGCLRQNIRVALSPAIGPCCCRVSGDVARQVAGHLVKDVLLPGKDGLYFDLPGYHLRLLQEAGVKEKNIIEMEIMPDHVHLLVEVDPQFGVHKLVKQIKGASSRVLRKEYLQLRTKLPTLWTNSYFVSTVGGAPLEIVRQYIENQKISQRK